MRPGTRLGVDVGSVRVGVAASDPSGLLATPVTTLRRGRDDLAAITALVAERQVLEVLVGLPVTLRNQQGAAADSARAYARELAARVGCPVRLVDERLTTVTAQRDLRASGVGSRRGRSVVDQAAAVIIVQAALDTERSTGAPPGQLVEAPGRTGGATTSPPGAAAAEGER